MGSIDIAIIVLILLSAVISIFRGFVREVLSLVAWVAAFYISLRFSGRFTDFLKPYIEIETIRMGAAFLGIFFIVLIAFSIFNFVINKLVEGTGLSGTDRFLGVIFGIARGGAIVMALVIILAQLTPLPDSDSWKNSFLIPHFQKAGQWVKGSLPEEYTKYLDVPSSQNSPPEVNEALSTEPESQLIEIIESIEGE